MQIIETFKPEALEQFKSKVWPSADREHYGERMPDFYKKEFTLVAIEGEEIVGYISVLIDSGVAQIEPLMVEPRGKGIGSALILAAETKAKEIGVHKMWLETGSTWEAKKFYEKHGYVVRIILPNHTGGYEFVLMDKMI